MQRDRSERALHDPDELITILNWCRRRLADRFTQRHLDELYAQIRGFIAPESGDGPTSCA
jgi:hypothetical protein